MSKQVNIPVATAVPVQEQQHAIQQQHTYPGQQYSSGQPNAMHVTHSLPPPITSNQPQVIYVQAPQDPRLACRGIQPGGMYTRENYCGPISLVIGLLVFPCICCCPCDEREVYIEPGTGRRVILGSY